MVTARMTIPAKLMLNLGLIMALALPAYAATDLNSQIDKLVDRLTTSLSGEVLKGSESQVYLSIGQKQGVVQGHHFEIIRPGEPLKIDGEVIGHEETKIAQVTVNRVREKISICTFNKKNQIPQKGDKAYQLQKKMKRLLVSQFSYQQSFNQLTKSLQDKLVTSMANRGKQVVEREQLERVLKEQELGYSGLVNIESARKVGKLLGAEGILLGTINDMGNDISLNARLVSIESGDTISAGEVELPKTPLIAQLLDIPAEDKAFIPPKKKKVKKIKNERLIQKTAGFTFKLNKCKKAGDEVACSLMITNETNDRELLLYANGYSNKTRMFDINGNRWIAGAVRMGGGYRSDKIRTTLIKDVPVGADFVFGKVDSKIDRATAIEINGYSEKGLKIQFRDIEFTY